MAALSIENSTEHAAISIEIRVGGGAFAQTLSLFIAAALAKSIVFNLKCIIFNIKSIIFNTKPSHFQYKIQAPRYLPGDPLHVPDVKSAPDVRSETSPNNQLYRGNFPC